MKKRDYKTKRLTLAALLIAVAFILSWIEMIISFPVAVPGIKIGLANIAILFAMYYCGITDAACVLVGRLVLSALLFGNASSLIIGAAGGVLSFAVMLLCKKMFGKHIIYVSIVGGTAHNIGQLIAASVIVRTSFFSFLPYLIIGGTAAGAFNGFLVSRLLNSSFFKNNGYLKK